MSAVAGHGAAVRIENCGKTFADGTRALEPATLDIARGETLVLLGPSGCGKTTMLRIIAGLELPDTGGKVLFDGKEMTSVPIEQRNVGMVFQSYALFPNMSVADNIGYGLKIRGMSKQERAKRVAELVALTNITGLENRRIDQLSGGHSEIEIKDLKVPADNLLGGEGNGFNMGQHRLAYGRLRHGMHNIAKAQRALDMAVGHVTKRSTFGVLLADRQAVQFMLAECASQLYIGRLMLLHIAYKAEKGMDLRQENSIAKVYLAHMVHHVIDTAIQLHGALGFSQDTILAKWYTQVRSQRLVDGPDEVHRWRVGRNVIKAFREHGTTALAAGGDLL